MSQVAVERLVHPIQLAFRRRRMEHFAKLFQLTEKTRILDVGGTPSNWSLIPMKPQVTLYNTLATEMRGAPSHVTSVVGDGRSLPYAPGDFDLVYSNSVIEHVGEWSDQLRFARGIRALNTSYYVQTPNQWFPIEPHLLGLGVHYLPKRYQYPWLLRYGTIWGLIGKPTKAQCEQFKRETHLLTRAQMAMCFPDADEIRSERVAGLAKSLIAVRVMPGSLVTKAGRSVLPL